MDNETFFVMEDMETGEYLHSGDMGIILQKPVAFEGAKPRVTTITIPGRNGDLHISDGSYENIKATVSCYFLSDSDYPASVMLREFSAFAAYLKQFKLYTSSDDFFGYRMARLAKYPQQEIRAGVLAPFTLEFDCDPRFFINEGLDYYTVDNQGVLNNYAMPSKPLIILTGNFSDGGYIDVLNELTEKTFQVDINSIDGELWLDCETMNAYRYDSNGVLENWNWAVSTAEFPELAMGANIFLFSENITKVEVQPRWWSL